MTLSSSQHGTRPSATSSFPRVAKASVISFKASAQLRVRSLMWELTCILCMHLRVGIHPHSSKAAVIAIQIGRLESPGKFSAALRPSSMFTQDI